MGVRLIRVFLITLVAGSVSWWLFSDTYRRYAGVSPELRLSHWGSYQEFEMWQEIIAGFEKKYPDIHVKQEYITDRYEAKIQQLLVADAAPDVILFQDEPMPQFARAGKFEALDPWLKTPGLELNLERDYWDTSVISFAYEGKQYGVPIWGGDNLIFYNKDAFDRAGVPYPKDDWTFEDFLATTKKLTCDFDGDGRIDQFALLLPGWIYFLPWMWGYGAAVLDPSHKHWALFGPEAERALQFYRDLRFKYRVSPTLAELGQMGQNVGFLTGRVAMFTSGPWAMPFLNETKMRYDVAHFPRGPKGRHTRVTWDSLVMFSHSRKKDQAWKFIHYVASLEAQRIVAKYQRSVPALKAAKDAFIQGNPRVSAHKFIEALKYARMQPISIYWGQMTRVISSEFEALGLGSQDAKSTIASFLSNRELMSLLPPVNAEYSAKLSVRPLWSAEAVRAVISARTRGRRIFTVKKVAKR